MTWMAKLSNMMSYGVLLWQEAPVTICAILYRWQKLMPVLFTLLSSPNRGPFGMNSASMVFTLQATS
jgi:hypothetical protein